eukprot:s588_g18.t2
MEDLSLKEVAPQDMPKQIDRQKSSCKTLTPKHRMDALPDAILVRLFFLHASSFGELLSSALCGKQWLQVFGSDALRNYREVLAKLCCVPCSLRESAAHDRMSWRLAYARDSRSHSRRLCLPLSPSSAHGESRDVRVENRSYLMRSLISMNTSMVEERQGLIQQSNEASASADRLRLQMDDMRDKHQLQLDEAVDRARQEERDRFELEKKELKAEHDRALRLAQAGI